MTENSAIDHRVARGWPSAETAGALPFNPGSRVEAGHRKSYYRNDTKTH